MNEQIQLLERKPYGTFKDPPDLPDPDPSGISNPFEVLDMTPEATEERKSFYQGVENQVVSWKFVVVAGLIILAYLFLGVTFFVFSENWPLVDSFLFTVVTICSLGVSEVYPNNSISRMFAVAYILVGITMAGYALSIIGIYVISREENLAEQGRQVVRPGFHWKKLVFLLSAFFFIVTVGTLSSYYWFKIDFISAIYYAVVTCAGVGYGDIRPQTTPQKWFFAFYILAGTTVATASLAGIADMFMEHQQQRIARKILNTRITIGKLALMDTDGDGKVTEQEFLENMLIALGKVRPDEISRIKRKFMRLNPVDNDWEDDGTTPPDSDEEDYYESSHSGDGGTSGGGSSQERSPSPQRRSPSPQPQLSESFYRGKHQSLHYISPAKLAELQALAFAQQPPSRSRSPSPSRDPGSPKVVPLQLSDSLCYRGKHQSLHYMAMSPKAQAELQNISNHPDKAHAPQIGVTKPQVDPNVPHHPTFRGRQLTSSHEREPASPHGPSSTPVAQPPEAQHAADSIFRGRHDSLHYGQGLAPRKTRASVSMSPGTPRSRSASSSDLQQPSSPRSRPSSSNLQQPSSPRSKPPLADLQLQLGGTVPRRSSVADLGTPRVGVTPGTPRQRPQTVDPLGTPRPKTSSDPLARGKLDLRLPLKKLGGGSGGFPTTADTPRPVRQTTVDPLIPPGTPRPKIQTTSSISIHPPDTPPGSDPPSPQKSRSPSPIKKSLLKPGSTTKQISKTLAVGRKKQPNLKITPPSPEPTHAAPPSQPPPLKVIPQTSNHPHPLPTPPQPGTPPIQKTNHPHPLPTPPAQTAQPPQPPTKEPDVILKD